MGLPPLDNLARIRSLKAEARDGGEVTRLLKMAEVRLADSRQAGVSLEGRFMSAYTAAHAAALAALRWQGYRSDNRYLVFQCLEHTVGWPPARWRVLAGAHHARNRAEYEGFFEGEERGLAELVSIAEDLVGDVRRMVGQ